MKPQSMADIGSPTRRVGELETIKERHNFVKGFGARSPTRTKKKV